MPITLQDFAAGNQDYVARHNSNNAAIKAAIDSLQAQVLASSGEGADLVLDLWDRDGIVGAHSYVLDGENYPGGSQISIGRRPAPTGMELDVSIAWLTVMGNKTRVQQVDDVVLDAAAITTGLPKTIYVGIPSNGTAQLFEDTATLNVLYVYSMTWDGFNLTNFKRIAHILPAYSTLQRLAGAPRYREVLDSETDWISDTVGQTHIAFAGAADDNGIGIDGAVEILGFFACAAKPDADGFFSPGDPPGSVVSFKVVSEAEDWTVAPHFEFDCSNIPDVIFLPVNPSVGDQKFVTEVQIFELERTSLGAGVVSARCFTWGVIYRPLIGAPMPRTTAVSQI